MSAFLTGVGLRINADEHELYRVLASDSGVSHRDIYRAGLLALASQSQSVGVKSAAEAVSNGKD